MNPAQKALWYVESHLADSLTLDEIASVGGVSRFHMVRSFAEATGMSVMRYVRARRLTKAARALAKGAPDILTLALEADYGSHEAFTRAFRDHFGVTPEQVRAATCLDKLRLQEPIVMDSTLARICNRRVSRPPRPCSLPASANAIIIAKAAAPAFPTSGSSFTRRSATSRPVGSLAFGVCCNGDDSGNFDYIAGVEVSDFSDLPREFARVRIPAQHYVVFTPHRAHLDHPPHRRTRSGISGCRSPA